jgi:membrane protein DedA with SNARE-associated domain
VISAIQTYGALGVFALMIPESACVPIPSEVTLIFSGVAVHQGWMSFPLAVIAATAGNLVGSLLAYGVGASGVLAGVPVAGATLRRWETMLDRRGMRAVLLARLTPLARTFVSLPAGARRLPLGPFVGLTTLGCALWAVAFIVVGLLAGAAWSEVSSVVGRVLLGVGLLTLGLPSVGRRRGRQRPDRSTRVK